MDEQDIILDDITRKKTYLVWSCRENGPNATSENYDSLETRRKKKRGRRRRTWKDGIYTAMNERDLRMGEWNNRSNRI
jgi:hypothetical protein